MGQPLGTEPATGSCYVNTGKVRNSAWQQVACEAPVQQTAIAVGLFVLSCRAGMLTQRQVLLIMRPGLEQAIKSSASH